MSTPSTQPAGSLGIIVTDWRVRLEAVVDTMREMSTHTDPQAMVRAYGARVRQLYRHEGFLSLSRRGLSDPYYRITRHSHWAGDINPWTEKDRLPLLKGGLLGELIYGDQPRIIDRIALEPGDPSAPHLEGYQSLMALPNYDGGHVGNLHSLVVCAEGTDELHRHDPSFTSPAARQACATMLPSAPHRNIDKSQARRRR